MEQKGDAPMIIKSNTPLSDYELLRVREIMQVSTYPFESLQMAFPGVRIKLTDDILYVGNPPWDLTQEIQY